MRLPPGCKVRFYEGFTRVPPEFHEVLQELRGGPRWFEVRFHEGSTRVPPVSPGFHHGSRVALR